MKYSTKFEGTSNEFQAIKTRVLSAAQYFAGVCGFPIEMSELTENVGTAVETLVTGVSVPGVNIKLSCAKAEDRAPGVGVDFTMTYEVAEEDLMFILGLVDRIGDKIKPIVSLLRTAYDMGVSFGTDLTDLASTYAEHFNRGKRYGVVLIDQFKANGMLAVTLIEDDGYGVHVSPAVSFKGRLFEDLNVQLVRDEVAAGHITWFPTDGDEAIENWSDAYDAMEAFLEGAATKYDRFFVLTETETADDDEPTFSAKLIRQSMEQQIHEVNAESVGSVPPTILSFIHDYSDDQPMTRRASREVFDKAVENAKALHAKWENARKTTPASEFGSAKDRNKHSKSASEAPVDDHSPEEPNNE